ncbi:hypothetical protein OC842_006480 [Tilletia horrida]|uniref:DNA damage-binding protein 1 n=1 Tax=Tilletia horrida TaxID=155126 RepID=A0AAN6JHX6_9BASI|nr:hypothetical protein OC842_006480 [Tilletia horrida]
MLYLTHLHAPSARSASLRTAAGTLALVGHTSIDLLALPTDDNENDAADNANDAAGGSNGSAREPFTKLATLAVNARILQAAVLPGWRGSLLVLTDHPAPRLMVLTPDPASKRNSSTTPVAYATHSVVQLQDTVRPPAELGVGMCMDEFGALDEAHTPIVFTHTYSGNARVVPLAADALAQPPGGQSGIGALAGFDVRNLGTGPLPPLVALLSLSSTPTSLPGLGPQCLPVLSFHWIDLDKQELAPCPWGKPPTPGTPASPTLKKSSSTAEASSGSSSGNTAGPGPRRSFRTSIGQTSASKPMIYGPSAKGADRSVAALIARDKKLAAQGIARAHVPIPYIEALGAHYLLALPARAGGGVLVFSETCILYVPPPPSALGDAPASASSSDGPELSSNSSSSSAAATSGSPSKGKRRKGTEPESEGFGAMKPSTSPLEASNTVNEHGKRRRASEATLGGNANPGDIIRTAFRKPLQIMSAIVQAEPSATGEPKEDGVREIGIDGRTAALRVLFATQAGQLFSLVLSLTAENDRSDGKRMYSPLSMQVVKIGAVPRPGSGSGGLLYLGDGFLQVASMVGDSALVRVDPAFVTSGSAAATTSAEGKREEWEDDSMDITERDSSQGGATSGSVGAGVQEFRRFPNLAPIVDFVIDDGPARQGATPSTTAAAPALGTAPSSSSSSGSGSGSGSSSHVAARIVTCSGTGPSGSLRSVKTGAEIMELGTMPLAPGSTPSAVFNLALEGSVGQEQSIVLLAYPERTEAFAQLIVDGDLHWEGLGEGLDAAGLSRETTLAAAPLAGYQGGIIVLSNKALRVLALREGRLEAVSEWKSPTPSTVAAVDSDGRIVLVSGSRTLIHLHAEASASGETVSIQQVATSDVDDEIATLSLQTIQAGSETLTLATVGLFIKRTVRLLRVPTLEDVTPELLAMQTFISLPNCALVHPFCSGAAQRGNTYLFVGLLDGSLVSFHLESARSHGDNGDGDIDIDIRDGPAASSPPSVKLSISDRRIVSLGSTPLRSLTPLRTTRGVEGLLVAGDKPVLLYEQNGRLNYSALSYGALSAAHATLPTSRTAASEILLVRSTSSVSSKSASSSASALGTSSGSGSSPAASLHILRMGEVKKVEIETLPLGVDNPLGITLDASEGKRAFGVVTWKYVAEGDGAVVDAKGKAKRGKGARGRVIVVHQDTFETIDTYELEVGEHPHCIETVTMDGRNFFVVGTGWDNPMESETTSGRILGLELVPSRWKSGDRELAVAFSQKVRGGVNAIVGAGGGLVAAINSQVVFYTTRPSKLADRELGLQRQGAWACAFFATTLVAPRGDPEHVLVGDAMRSMVVLKLEVDGGSLSEVARECDPSWTSAVEQLSARAQSYVGADMSFNLFVSARTLVTPVVRRRKEAAARAMGTDLEGRVREPGAGERSSNTEPPMEKEFTHVIKRRGAFHLGDMVNRFRKGALLHEEGLTVLGETVRPNVVFCTAGGALGVLADMGQRSGRLLAGLVQAIDDEIPTLGNVSLRERRAFRTDHREMPAVGFVDGDGLVGRFLSLGETERRRVVARWVEEMRAEAEAWEGGEDEDIGAIGEHGLVDAVASLARLC